MCHARAFRLCHVPLLALLLSAVPSGAFGQSAAASGAGQDPPPAPAAGQAPAPAPDPAIHILQSRPLTGALFAEVQLRDLPSSGSLWSLIETADHMTVVDRIQNGGLYLGEPELMGSLGSSWTQTGFTFDGLDVTHPARTGTPLLYLDPRVLASVEVMTSLPPVDVAGGGSTVALLPRAPASRFGGSLDAAGMPGAWQSAPDPEEAPAIAHFDSAADGGVLLSAPIASGGTGFLFSVRRGVARRFERTDPTLLENRLTSLFTHAFIRTAPDARLRIIAGTDAISRPFGARLRFPDRSVTANDQVPTTRTPSGSGRRRAAARGASRPGTPAAYRAPRRRPRRPSASSSGSPTAPSSRRSCQPAASPSGSTPSFASDPTSGW